MAIRVLVVLSSLLVCLHAAEPNLITQPQPGQEYVFVQTSDKAGARPVIRKEKEEIAERETAHKLPPNLTYLLQEDAARDKREASPAKAPIAAPAGAIKLDPLKLIEKYKAELATSTTTTTKKPATASSRRTHASRKKAAKTLGAASTTAAPSSTTEAPKRAAPKFPRSRGGLRTKKEVSLEDAPTTASSLVLTTAQAPELKAAGTENKKSRIHIKKGPNGQDYEYEYVYYYYDDEDDIKNKTDAVDPPKEKTTTPEPTKVEKVEKPNQNSVEKSSAKAEPASNEVVPASKSPKGKGRHLDEEESNIDTERLPANTRFPPRGRNLVTSPAPPAEPASEEPKIRSRTRGRGTTTTTAAPESDSTSEETRGRTRANVRRPSLDLVDNASFNTHSGTAGADGPPVGGPSFPSDLPAGPVRFLGATPNERMDLQDAKSNEAPTSTEQVDGETTTLVSAMDKVASDLYAVVQGTQKLSGEDSGETSTSSEEETTTILDTTPEVTTEVVTTEPTTTTTTTTTTAAPSTTAAPEGGPFGRGRYRGRNNARKTTPSSSTTETSNRNSESGSSKPKNRFASRPSFGSSRSRTRTTAEPSGEPEVAKEEAKPVSHSRPTLSRNRFGGARTRATTAAPSGDESPSSTAAAPRVGGSRTRPAFGGRRRPSSTAATPSESNENNENNSAETGTTARSRVRSSNSALVRPLRPGPRLNIGRLGKPGVSTTTTAAPAESSAEVSSAEDLNTNPPEDEKVAETTPAPTQDTNPLNRLRNRARLTVSAKPKTAASAPVPVRRTNPLLGRRKLEPSSTEASQDIAENNETLPASSAESSAEEVDTEATVPSSSTTEEPRGLNKLLAGRRRLAHRHQGTSN